MALTDAEIDTIAHVASQKLKVQVTEIIEEVSERTAHRVALSTEDTRRLMVETVSQTLIQLGIDQANPMETQRDFQHLRQWRLAKDQITNKTVMSLVGLMGVGIVALILIGLKDWFEKLVTALNNGGG